ncbi:glycosyltransferase family 4 protein [Patescibacteria group bacterium]|nr:glycosyltransferase family 4 protein [Patescibacteria group bacterium]MBU3999990.1 glycosyltransferase family 4 protein [Patescibacteria group bacterium]MBU4056646.1 glycosyltransferase family 4 protein [Patescibacteria group bacterium]
MRIGIDASTILNPEIGEAAGKGHYTFMLIRHLLKMDADFKNGKNEYVLFFDNRVRKKDIERFKMKSVKIHHFPFASHRRYLPGIYSEVLISGTLMREKLDILHSPGGFIPLTYRGKTIVTESNLAIHKFSDMFPRYQRLSAVFTRAILKKADFIITGSQASKSDIGDFFGLPGSKIKSIYKGIDQRFFNKVEQKEILRVRQKYKIRGRYFLFLSTIKPINNLSRLVEIFAGARRELAKQENQPHYQLVLAGKEGWLSDEVEEMTQAFRLAKDVILTGYIPPEDLNGLYQDADLFLFPPFYEEFGSPALEAMAIGVPVIASKTPALIETLGDAAMFIEPEDAQKWARAVVELAQNEGKRNDLIRLGLIQARKYTWEKTAEETLKVYRKVLGI